MSSLNELAKQHHVFVSSDSKVQRQLRLLQARWREMQGFPIGENRGKPLGSVLSMPYAKDTLHNYLTENIRAVLREEVMNPQKRADKMYGEPRIYNNLLSSQPLCFNLFGELTVDLPLATQIFQKLTNGRIAEVTRIDYEYSPGRGDARYSGDKSAFDVFVTYKTPSGKRGFAGIEVKYHENLRVKADEHRPRYDEIADYLGCFVDSKCKELHKPPLQQIWRDHLLAGALLQSGDYEEGFFVFLYPAINIHCGKAITAYRECLSTYDTFEVWTIEDVVMALKHSTNANWIDLLYDRYLNVEKL